MELLINLKMSGLVRCVTVKRRAAKHYYVAIRGSSGNALTSLFAGIRRNFICRRMAGTGFIQPY